MVLPEVLLGRKGLARGSSMSPGKPPKTVEEAVTRLLAEMPAENRERLAEAQTEEELGVPGTQYAIADIH